jgi:hypothetical protein
MKLCVATTSMTWGVLDEHNGTLAGKFATTSRNSWTVHIIYTWTL